MAKPSIGGMRCGALMRHVHDRYAQRTGRKRHTPRRKTTPARPHAAKRGQYKAAGQQGCCGGKMRAAEGKTDMLQAAGEALTRGKGGEACGGKGKGSAAAGRVFRAGKDCSGQN